MEEAERAMSNTALQDVQGKYEKILDLALEMRKENTRLREALELIPADLMLADGPPYTLNFSEETLKQISQATQQKDRKG
jgi:hypothetical protein